MFVWGFGDVVHLTASLQALFLWLVRCIAERRAAAEVTSSSGAGVLLDVICAQVWPQQKKGEKANLPRNGEKVLLASKGQVVVRWKEDHNQTNDEASLKPASRSSEPTGFAVGSGTVVVPQGEADKKEIAGSFSADMHITFNVVIAVVVVTAESNEHGLQSGPRGRHVGKRVISCLCYCCYI